MDKVITIGRQFGSGGHEVGYRLAKKLGIPFYDKEILEITAGNSRFAESYLKKMDEKRPSFLSFISNAAFGTSMSASSSGASTVQFYNMSPNDQVFLEQSKVMQDLASKGPCVIVGRCADYILRDEDTVDFFVQADLQDRIERKVALGECKDAVEAEKLIVGRDRDRAKFYEYYSHTKWGESRNYDLCVNTSLVGIDGAVDVMMAYLAHVESSVSIMPDDNDQQNQ